MQFTKLRLQGFKSFVDPTDLIIHEGLTGVVGPNGCGKSNLLEALRWVMGETRAKQMRGSGMDDVIFAGTKGRAAKPYAEVTLFVDNRNKLAPAAFNHLDELDIVRRITRDIGSAYKVNGKDARARDVAMMFADAATGAQSPSLVRQGQITELINAKPQSRRRILEDAAGISGLYQRRHEAELKLKNAESNLEQVDTVIEQLLSQMRSLERQAKAAERYSAIAKDLRAAQALLAYLEWQTASRSRLDASQAVTKDRTARAQAESARLEAQNFLNKISENLPKLRDENAIAAAVYQRLEHENGQIDSEIQRVQSEIQGLKDRSAVLEKDKLREEQIHNDASEAMKRLDWEKEQLALAREGEDDAILAKVESARLAHEALTALEENFEINRQNLAREEARAQAAERRYEDVTKRLHALKKALEQSEIEVETAKSQLEQAEQSCEFAQSHHDEAQDATQGYEEKIHQLRQNLELAENHSSQAQNHLAEITGNLSALEAEMRGLQSLTQKSRVDNPVLHEITVQSGYEKALGAALGEELNFPLTEKGTGWRYTDRQEKSLAPNGLKTLKEFVDAPKALHNRLSRIYVVQSAEPAQINALSPGEWLVTLEGDLHKWDGFSQYEADGSNAASNYLTQMNRLKALQAEIEQTNLAKAQAEEKWQSAKAAFLEHKQELQALENAARQADKNLTDAIRSLHQSQNDRDRRKSRFEMLKANHIAKNDDLALVQTDHNEAEKARVDPERFQSDRANLEAERLQVEEARSLMIDERAKLDAMRKEREARQQRLLNVEREIQNWQKRLDNTTSHQSDLSRRIDETAELLRLAIVKPQKIDEQKAVLQKKIADAHERLENAKTALAAGESERARADKDFREKESALADCREVQARSETAFEQAELLLSQIVESIKEKFQTTPEAMAERFADMSDRLPSIADAQEQIRKLISARDAMGAVNLRANEDRLAVEKEYEALVSDKAEITEAIQKLRTAIASLNKEGRERLVAAFDEVNANFQKLFTKLFDGGEAHLELVESDDPLNAGLEILCQPPGKKLSALSLLSGGEQTLTAMALIFAVFLTNPSPICVLDEVDAPLDDANVTRFCDLLDEMTRQTETRFLLITHHALTMSRMDRLFGVTMAERGVSQLVSVDLKDAEALVESDAS